MVEASGPCRVCNDAKVQRDPHFVLDNGTRLHITCAAQLGAKVMNAQDAAQAAQAGLQAKTVKGVGA